MKEKGLRMSTTPGPTGFFGWNRPNRGKPWVKVCEAEDERACWRALFAVRGGDTCVCAAGIDPNERPLGGKGREGSQR